MCIKVMLQSEKQRKKNILKATKGGKMTDSLQRSSPNGDLKRGDGIVSVHKERPVNPRTLEYPQQRSRQSGWCAAGCFLLREILPVPR